ncbi:helix-turn-helix domain-containing protein [Georgenia thermotolerans]|uniref:helix-turn-helix domain-containing protein n=1 Tax=Georgenia thermotolerans TaxID=527326 RepID=UPI0014785A2B|nr:helix-turn-helix domain-containing protein [Georgenia thermotolerans]
MKDQRKSAAPFIGTVEAAEVLGRPKSWMYDGADKAGVPVYKVGRRRMYLRDEIIAFVRSQALVGAV